jgi:hypothetical protein
VDAELKLTLLDVDETEKDTSTSKAKTMHMPNSKGKGDLAFQQYTNSLLNELTTFFECNRAQDTT